MMTDETYRRHLKKLGLNQRGVAVFLDHTERSSRRFAAGERIPRPIELLLRVMVQHKLTPDDVFRLAGYKPPKEGWGDITPATKKKRKSKK
jgi:hypothetical protein